MTGRVAPSLAYEPERRSATNAAAPAIAVRWRPPTVFACHVDGYLVADQFHHHTGASENVKSIKQSDATGATGECAALSRPNPHGNGVPIASRERQTALQDARRDGIRGHLRATGMPTNMEGGIPPPRLPLLDA